MFFHMNILSAFVFIFSINFSGSPTSFSVWQELNSFWRVHTLPILSSWKTTFLDLLHSQSLLPLVFSDFSLNEDSLFLIFCWAVVQETNVALLYRSYNTGWQSFINFLSGSLCTGGIPSKCISHGPNHCGHWSVYNLYRTCLQEDSCPVANMNRVQQRPAGLLGCLREHSGHRRAGGTEQDLCSSLSDMNTSWQLGFCVKELALKEMGLLLITKFRYCCWKGHCALV